MGIGNTQARAMIAAIKAGTNRKQMRVQMGQAAETINDWLRQRDMQDAQAQTDFIALPGESAAFDAFVAGLPDPIV